MNLRDLERASIRRFVQQAADDGYLSGRVLDYGCGKQPYRDIVEAVGGEYEGFDRADLPASVNGNVGDYPWGEVEWDAILCTQVVQYLPMYPYYADSSVQSVLSDFRVETKIGGHLVLTYPTHWPEVEPEDLHRFTKAGMERLLTEAGFEIVRHKPRARFDTDIATEWFYTGYGVIARA